MLTPRSLGCALLLLSLLAVAGASPDDLRGTKWHGKRTDLNDSWSVRGTISKSDGEQLILVTTEEDGMKLEWTFNAGNGKLSLASFRQVGGKPHRTYREERAIGTFSDEKISVHYSWQWFGPGRKNVHSEGDLTLSIARS